MKKLFKILIALFIILLLGLFLIVIIFLYGSSTVQYLTSLHIQDEALKKCVREPSITWGGQHPRKDCLFTLAIEREDINICEYNQGGDTQECKRGVAITSQNISICHTIDKELKQTEYPSHQLELVGKCYTGVAMSLNDSSLCEESHDDDMRLYCAFHFETEESRVEIVETVNPKSKICDYIDSYTPETQLDTYYLLWIRKGC